MVHGYHVIFGAYGFWLPNDPRGSWSDFVASWELFRFGRPVRPAEVRSVAADPHDQSLRLAAKQALMYPAVRFSGAQAAAIGQGFNCAGREGGYIIHACAILPEHVHMVLARHVRHVRRIIGHLKARATRRLRQLGLWPDGRPVWAEGGWSVFLDSEDRMGEAIRYVEENPLKEGKRRQRWSFVVPYGQRI